MVTLNELSSYMHRTHVYLLTRLVSVVIISLECKHVTALVLPAHPARRHSVSLNG